MATSRFAPANGLLAGTRYGRENQENGTALPGKTRSTATARAALGNVSNKAALHTQAEGKKEATKASRGMTKSTATSSLHAVADKENAITIKADKDVKEVKASEVPRKQLAPKSQDALPKKAVSSPAPMDISANSDNGAFSKRLLVNVQDIDKDDHLNPQLVSVYVNDIYNYMWELERKCPIKHHYLDTLAINGRMRGILIDWLIQVHLRFHLLQETLYLTVGIIDRFLQEQEVSRSKLQLVGVTSMLIASKYEEMYAPEIADFVYITDNAYSKSDIRKMECLILKALDFNLGRPLPLHFLRRNSKAGEVDATKHTLAKYLMELTVVDYEMVHIHPSEIAAAALCLSMKTLDNSPWSETLEYYSKYSEADLQATVKKMAILVQKAGTGKLTAVKTKYQSSKFMRISTIPELKGTVIQEAAK